MVELYSGYRTPAGAPMRLVLLGEKLIAFRDSSGRVGVMDHRCASQTPQGPFDRVNTRA